MVGYLGDTYDQDLPVVVIVESRMVAGPARRRRDAGELDGCVADRGPVFA